MAVPVPKPMVSVKRSADALKRLCVSADELATAPQITPLLRSAAGGMRSVIAAMRLVPDEVTASFLAKYDSIAAFDRKCLPIEAIALAAGVDILHLLGAAHVAVQSQAVQLVKLIATSNHPAVTRARIKFAKLAGGERDRTALDTAMGFLPSPKGPTFIGKAIFGSGKAVMDAQGAGGEDDDDALADSDPDLDKLFPPANAMQEKLTPIRQRLLPG